MQALFQYRTRPTELAGWSDTVQSSHRPGDGYIWRGSASVVNLSSVDYIFNTWKHVHNSGHKGGGVKKSRPSSIGSREKNLGLHAI